MDGHSFHVLHARHILWCTSVHCSVEKYYKKLFKNPWTKSIERTSNQSYPSNSFVILKRRGILELFENLILNALGQRFFLSLFTGPFWTCFRIWIFWKIDCMKIDWKRKQFGLLKMKNFNNILSNLGRFLEILKKPKKNSCFSKKKQCE